MEQESNIAFKEWAAIVNALAQGKQILILRKGGIHEEGDKFHPDYHEFFLFPTYEHQSKEDLKPEAHGDLEMLIQTKPEPETIPIRYFAKTVGVLHLREEIEVERLASYHIWSTQAIRQRFHFGRDKGLFALAVRIFILPFPHLVSMLPEYGGCKSWVQLDHKLSTEGARPVVSDAEFLQRWQTICSLFARSSQIS